MKRRDLINIILFSMVFAFAAYRYSTRTLSSQKTAFVMDTLVDIKIETKFKDTEEILETAFQLIEKYENKFSMYKAESVIWKFNNSELDSLQLDKDLVQLLSLAKELNQKTNSHYDITIGALSEIWDFDEQEIPSEKEIEKAIKNTGFQKLNFKKDILEKPAEMKINLGSLAKGFIVDEVAEYLMQTGVVSGIVNAGGDMFIFGKKKPLKIGIQHPRGESNEIIDVIKVGNRAIVTSGDYERYFITGGKRYHHIIDPITGYPSDNAISVTVIAETTMLADAYSTALFLLEPDKALKLAENTEGLDAVIYYMQDDKIEKLGTSRMKDYH